MGFRDSVRCIPLQFCDSAFLSLILHSYRMILNKVLFITLDEVAFNKVRNFAPSFVTFPGQSTSERIDLLHHPRGSTSRS